MLDKFYVGARQSTDFEALELRNVRLGIAAVLDMWARTQPVGEREREKGRK